MALLPISKRPAHLGTCLVLLAGLISACSLIAPSQYGVPKLYIKDFTLRARGEAIGASPGTSSLSAQMTQLQAFNYIGVFFSPTALISMDPVFTLATSESIALPAADMTTEPAVDANGNPTTETVLNKPLFMLDSMTVSYDVPGFTVPPVTLQENLPIKSNTFTVPPQPLPVIGSLMQALTSGAQNEIHGTMTVSFATRDLDPLTTNPSFTVSRTFPFVYTSTSVIASETMDQQPGVVSQSPLSQGVLGGAPAPLPPAASPPAASAVPSASPSASPTVAPPGQQPGASPAPLPSPTVSH